MYISNLGFTWRAAYVTVLRTLMVDGTVSIWRPPLLETQMASAPSLAAKAPSSAVMIPLTTTGFFVYDFTYAMSLDFQALSISILLF
jgi:hypothetical protein